MINEIWGQALLHHLLTFVESFCVLAREYEFIAGSTARFKIFRIVSFTEDLVVKDTVGEINLKQEPFIRVKLE